MRRRRTKYGNQKIEFDGKKFASKKELERYKHLKAMQELGVISDLRMQKTFVLTEKGKRNPVTGKAIVPVKYIADFTYVDAETGKTVVEDVKGYKDPGNSAYRIFRIKQKMMYDRFGIWIKET